MQVTNKEMYHFHNNKAHNELWVPNSEIIVDDNFVSYYSDILKYFTTTVKIQDGNRAPFNRVIESYLKEEQDIKTLKELLEEAKNIIYGTNIFKRELALEEVRRLKYPNLPSRIHSIWLCDEKGIPFWEDQISDGGRLEVDLYKVLVTGEIFKSSDCFIPSNKVNFQTNLEQAHEYWNPDFKTEEQELKSEYLFQGKLKILEKIETKQFLK